MPKKLKLTDKPIDEPMFELAPVTPVVVAQTNRLFRLAPVGHDLAQPHRQISLVAVETEEEARALAELHDPFGRMWTDKQKFASDVLEDEKAHVVGDVVFKSIPAHIPLKKKSGV